MILLRDGAEQSLLGIRFPVGAGLSLHQDEFNIVFYHGVWFEGFPEDSPAAVADLKRGIGDLVPDDG